MAKIVMTAALFLAILAMASAYTTITIVEEESRWGRPRARQDTCRAQIQQQQQLRDCQSYLQEDEQEESLRMVVPRRAQHQRQCCQQLENIEEECRCEAIRHLVRQQQQQQQEEGRRGYQQQEKKLQQVVGKVMDLPRRCNVEVRQCQIRAIWF